MHARVVLGVGNGVLFREVSSVLGCPHFRMHARVVLGVGNGVLFREVSSVLGCPHRREGAPLYYTYTKDT